MAHKQIPVEALINLRHRLDGLPSRCRERRIIIAETAALYGVSTDTLYRALRNAARPNSINRADNGVPRKLPLKEMERYCEIVAAMKIRTSNKKGRMFLLDERLNCWKNLAWRHLTALSSHPKVH